jgi:hypothetical protein
MTLKRSTTSPRLRRTAVARAVVYYAITDESTSLAHPAGVLRRIDQGAGKIDEVFSGALTWVPSPLLRSAEHGDVTNEFTEISEEEAERIVAHIRADASDV